MVLVAAGPPCVVGWWTAAGAAAVVVARSGGRGRGGGGRRRAAGAVVVVVPVVVVVVVVLHAGRVGPAGSGVGWAGRPAAPAGIELGRLADDLLGLPPVLHPRQLDHDLVALAGDLGLSDAEAVDPLADDLLGLLDGAVAGPPLAVRSTTENPPWRSRPSWGELFGDMVAEGDSGDEDDDDRGERPSRHGPASGRPSWSSASFGLVEPVRPDASASADGAAGIRSSTPSATSSMAISSVSEMMGRRCRRGGDDLVAYLERGHERLLLRMRCCCGRSMRKYMASRSSGRMRYCMQHRGTREGEPYRNGAAHLTACSPRCTGTGRRSRPPQAARRPAPIAPAVRATRARSRTRCGWSPAGRPGSPTCRRCRR